MILTLLIKEPPQLMANMPFAKEISHFIIIKFYFVKILRFLYSKTPIQGKSWISVSSPE